MFRELFNIPVVINRPTVTPIRDLQPPGSRDGVTPPSSSPPPEIQREGAFITVQSLVSFPGATAAVTVLATVAGWAVPAWRGRPLVFLLASLAVGLTIYLINESDPAKPPVTLKQRMVGFIIAVFNTFVILSAAVGANSMINSEGTPTTQVQPMEVNHG